MEVHQVVVHVRIQTLINVNLFLVIIIHRVFRLHLLVGEVLEVVVFHNVPLCHG